MFLYDFLPLLSIMFLRFFYVVAFNIISLWKIILLYECSQFSFIHLILDRHLDCLYSLSIMNGAAMSMCIQYFGEAYVFISPRYMPRPGMVETYGYIFRHYPNS